MPSDNASGVPTMATAMARPCRAGDTIRLACPASSAHKRPENTPAPNRAASVNAKEVDTAVTTLTTQKPPMAISSSGRRRQAWVALTRGMAASTEPRA